MGNDGYLKMGGDGNLDKRRYPDLFLDFSSSFFVALTVPIAKEVAVWPHRVVFAAKDGNQPHKNRQGAIIIEFES